MKQTNKELILVQDEMRSLKAAMRTLEQVAAATG